MAAIVMVALLAFIVFALRPNEREFHDVKQTSRFNGKVRIITREQEDEIERGGWF